eukprot:UN1051
MPQAQGEAPDTPPGYNGAPPLRVTDSAIAPSARNDDDNDDAAAADEDAVLQYEHQYFLRSHVRSDRRRLLQGTLAGRGTTCRRRQPRRRCAARSAPKTALQKVAHPAAASSPSRSAAQSRAPVAPTKAMADAAVKTQTHGQKHRHGRSEMGSAIISGIPEQDLDRHHREGHEDAEHQAC